MNFGEKLYKLRKEKGMSQEELAQKVNTTRQAVSKWENNQGFPETEKLMQLGNIFEVSIDYLLKESDHTTTEKNSGYYVSQEFAQGYLAYEKRIAAYIAFGFGSLLLAGIPYVLMHGTERMIAMSFLIILGIMFFITGILKEEKHYDVLKKEPLIFDQTFIKNLTSEYAQVKKKYHILLSISLLLIALGVVPIVISIKGYGFEGEFQELHSLSFLLISIGFLGFIYIVSHMEAYELLIKNDEYSNKFIVKLKRKCKKKFEEM